VSPPFQIIEILRLQRYTVKQYMAEKNIPPVKADFSSPQAAIVGSQAAIFTAADRKIIEERGGEVADRKKSFLEKLAEKPLAPPVENEEPPEKTETNAVEVIGRFQRHTKDLKHSAITAPRDRADISKIIPPAEAAIGLPQEGQSLPDKKEEQDKKNRQKIELHEEAAAAAKDLKLNPADLYDKFTLEQSGLYNLLFRIKDLHLKRLLSVNQEEFRETTAIIKKETLSSSRPEARAWVEGQIDLLTKSAAEYKLKLIKSMQILHFDESRTKDIAWLQKIIDGLTT